MLRYLFKIQLEIWWFGESVFITSAALSAASRFLTLSFFCFSVMESGSLSMRSLSKSDFLPLAYGKKYAVYDIGDGTMDWQLRAESSLFYYKYGSFETKADGMILICEDGRKHEIARQIIRQTMWVRKTLLKDRYAETDKPVK